MFIGTSIEGESPDGEFFLRPVCQTVQALTLTKQLNKQELELAQVEHFQKLVSENAELSFQIELAGDRPDFWIQRRGQRIGLDVAALASTERRRAVDQFRKLKLVLMAAYRRGRLRRCRGIEVQLFFSTDRIPTQARFEKSVDELIGALEGYEINEDEWGRVSHASFMSGHEPFPLGQSGSTTDGLMNWHVSGRVMTETLFSKVCGFNIEHQFEEAITVAQFSTELSRVISAHDVAGQRIEELLLVAGGPDIFGEASAGESVVPTVYFNEWKGTIAIPANLNRVFLDNWFINKPQLLFDRSTGFLINT